MTESLHDWIDRQYRYSAAAMLAGFSRVDLLKWRPGFGQSIRPHPGSILASPVMADWDPEPDYFFHWYRDSAIVIDALRLLFEDGTLGAEAVGRLADFVRFSLGLQALDGRVLIASPDWCAGVTREFYNFLRSGIELAAVHGDAVAAETRVNADGTLDISSWSRPQHDGAPLRALAMLRWLRRLPSDETLRTDISTLLRADLAFCYRYACLPAHDMWEEEQGLHFHTLSASAAALEAGAGFLSAAGDLELSLQYSAEARAIRQRLDGFWQPEAGYYRSRIAAGGEASKKELDISVILAAVHTADESEEHSPADTRMQATLSRLDALFDADYPINRDRPAGRRPAMGRYAGDVYFSGGAYYFSTLGAAEFCYRAALQATEAQSWIDRGDAYLATVQAFTPADGQLSEQFDQKTGVQTSARHLTWSYAAFISCISARRRVIGGAGVSGLLQ